MLAISANELADIQAEAAAAACDLSCVIKRGTRTPVASGGASVAFNPIATVNAGMTQPTAGQLQNYNYIIADKSAWMVKFAIGTDVKEKDQLVIGGLTMTVAKVLNPRSYPTLITALATEV
jgi:hypothetical protein